MTDVPSNLIPTRITQLPEYEGDSTEGYAPYAVEGRTYKAKLANIVAPLADDVAIAAAAAEAARDAAQTYKFQTEALAQDGADSALLAQAWAEGTEPGGPNTDSSKGWSYQSQGFALSLETDAAGGFYDSLAAGVADPAVAVGDAFNIIEDGRHYVGRKTGASTGEIVAEYATTGFAEAISGPGGAGEVGFLQSGTGAAARTVQSKLRDTVSVKDFGAVGDGVTDDTAAIQAAINTGKPLVFPAGNYKSGPLTQSANFQRFYADGHVNITKNANGVLFTSTGNYVELGGLQFVGTGYTGDNINMTGGHPRLVNCASYGTPGRALKATGAHVQVIGTCGIYATTDTTATGYDIEIGVSGTATLYHQLYGVYTSQATGGILLVDTGSHSILGGQFGKLTIQSGTSPAGVNGGVTANARILGNVDVGISNSVFTGNQFSTQTITFGAGTSGHSLDETNLLANATIVNNGNANSSIVKSVGAGSPTGIVLQYGADAGKVTVRYSNAVLEVLDGSFILANNRNIQFRDSGGNAVTGVTFSAADDWTFGASNGSNFTNLASGTGGAYVVVGGTTIAQFYASGLRPQTDGTLNLGTSSQKWNQVHGKAYYVDGLKVVGAQGAAVADATGAGDVVAQLNALLARLRTHGLIAT